MIQRALHHLDGLLMGRIFQPIAHWADYRWHVNHFRLALFCLKCGLVTNAAGAFASWLPHPTWLGGTSFGITLFNVWIAKGWLRDLPAASDAYERDPTRVPRQAYGFVFAPPPIRAMMVITCVLLFGMILAPAILLLAYGLMLQAFYLVFMAAMFYFAGVIPSG